MNCQDFENIAGDLARTLPLEARTREEARAHEGACPRCAARLADERALGEGLRGLAEGASAVEAPPRVEANLLAAFRAQAARRAGTGSRNVEGEPVPAVEKVVPFARPSAPRRWSWVKTAAASATAAAAAVTLFVLVAPQKSSTPRATQTRSAEPVVAALTPPVTPETGVPNTPIINPARQDDGRSDDVVRRASYAPRGVRTQGRLTTTPAAFRNESGRATGPSRGSNAGGAEIATSFIPLTQDAALAAADGGQVVRVEMDRTALQRFGLPMNVERAGERVKADVLFGHDGVARAIRFVR
jgi:hypothetical protein